MSRLISALRALRERPFWFALIFSIISITAAYQRPVFLDVGSRTDALYTSNFHDAEESGQATFRWTTVSSTLLIPGAGKPLGTMPITLQMSSGSRDAPVTVDVWANGNKAATLIIGSESSPHSIDVAPWVDASGDLRLDLNTPIFQAPEDKRYLGVILDFARIDLPFGSTLPSISQLLLLIIAAALLYLSIRLCNISSQAAGLVTGILLLLCSFILAWQRVLVTTYTTRLVAALVIALLGGLLAEQIVRYASRLAGWRGGRSLPEWAWIGLRGLLMLSIALKVGGLLHPYTFIIDAPFHFRYIGFMAEGKPWDEYFGEGLALSVMPKEEWGSAKAFIPYSPFFYVIAAPLAWLPLPLSISVPIASGLLDSLKVGMVFLLGLALSRRGIGHTPRTSGRFALAAAAVFAFIPATFLLQQWGNWPTQSSLWLLTLWATVVCLFWSRFTQPVTWLISTGILTLTMLAYTVTAGYTGIFVGLLVVTGFLVAASERKRWGALGLSLIAATLLALLIYYGQYVGKVLGETLPTFGQAIEEQGKLTTLRPSVWDFVTGHLAIAMHSYNLGIVYALGLAGTLLYLFLGKRTQAQTADTSAMFLSMRFGPIGARGKSKLHWREVWVAVWLLTLPIFTLADFYIDQALKQFWYALPVVSVVAGGWLLALMHKGASSRLYLYLTTLLFATLVWQSISLWVFRLFFHNR